VRPEVSETTQLLLNWADGDQVALQALTPHIYRELRRMAAGFIRREREQHTLQPTALVHEVYLKLVDVRKTNWKSKAHFYGACAQIMRRILVDAARKRSTVRRGGGMARTNISEVPDASLTRDSRLIALDDALNLLRTTDQRKAHVVELRYFGGMTAAETAEVLDESVHVVRHDLRLAHAWLRRNLSR